MENFTEYGHAFVAIAVWAIIAMILGPVTAALKGNAGLSPGETPKADYGDRLYRMERAHINTVETLGVMLAVVVIAILMGVSPFWVNLLTSVALISRILMIFVHIRGIGKAVQGPRTFLFVIGWGTQVALALMTIWAVF